MGELQPRNRIHNISFSLELDTHRNIISMALGLNDNKHNAAGHYAECCCAGCRIFIVILCVVTLNIVMLNVVMLNVFMLKVVILNVVMMSVVVLLI